MTEQIKIGDVVKPTETSAIEFELDPYLHGRVLKIATLHGTEDYPEQRIYIVQWPDGRMYHIASELDTLR